MQTIIGWDIGGAHLKGARVEENEVVAVSQVACPLWLGLDQLRQAFAQAKAALGAAEQHVATMTGELSDAFADRRVGVAEIAKAAMQEVGALEIFAGPRGFVSIDAAIEHADMVASANWYASASLVAQHHCDALFIDMGSTTTDIIPIRNGQVTSRGYSDATRMAKGELVYAGLVRSFLFAGLRLVPFGGRWVPLMNEAFATMSDVYRILGQLPEDADLMPTADDQAKTIPASRARLARQIGLDACDIGAEALDQLAAYFAEAQMHEISDGVFLVLSNVTNDPSEPIVGAGTGRFLIKRLASRFARHFVDIEDVLRARSDVRRKAADCLPACAVALLAANCHGR